MAKKLSAATVKFCVANVLEQIDEDFDHEGRGRAPLANQRQILATALAGVIVEEEVRNKKLTEVLALVNKGRKAMGMKPLKQLVAGEPSDSTNCPIYLSLHNALGNGAMSVDGNVVFNLSDRKYMNDEGEPNALHAKVVKMIKALGKAWGAKVVGEQTDFVIKSPKAIRAFITDFDSGDYPELDLSLR